MTGIVWLASYPKSGSTWLRMILANLECVDAPADINVPLKNSGMASSREAFDDTTLLTSGLLTDDETDSLRPDVYEAIRQRAEAVCDGLHFIKVHDAYARDLRGQPLFAGRRGASRCLVIVRDPRDIAPSLAHHLGTTIDQAIATMGSDQATFCRSRVGQAPQLRQRLGNWSDHVASWIDQDDVRALLVPFELMEANPADTFARAMAFAGRCVGRDQIERAVRFAAFGELRRQEQANGFEEAPLNAKGPFFREGKSGGWRKALSPDQVVRIERDHGPMMRRLGYALNTDQLSRRCAHPPR